MSHVCTIVHISIIQKVGMDKELLDSKTRQWKIMHPNHSKNRQKIFTYDLYGLQSFKNGTSHHPIEFNFQIYMEKT